MWFVLALLSAVFAALTSILAKAGIEGVNSHLATALRTMVVVVMAWGMVFLTGAQEGIARISVRSWSFLILSGLACGFLWTALYMAVFFQPARDLDGQTVRLTATVADWPQEGSYGGCTVLVRAETESWVKVSAILYTDGQGAGLRPGDRIETIAHCTLGDRTFAGEKITYYTAKGIFLRAQAYGRLEVERPTRVPPQYFAAWASRALKSGIDAAFPEDVAGFVRALVTGNRDNLTDEFTTSLERAGLSHTVAVSGMHLAFLASLLTALLGRGRRSTALFTILWVALFCGIAGNTPSVLRAAVMILMLQLAPLLDRERDGPTSLALALFLGRTEAVWLDGAPAGKGP